jgi:hypothetical protein
MGQKDEMIEMARLRKAGEPEPDEGEAGDDAEGNDGEDAGEDAADREESGTTFYAGNRSRCQQPSNSTTRRVLSCLHQMGICLGQKTIWT